MSICTPVVVNRRIQVLDTLLANQIAAGEVVERPASVLKELMENALDAGATRIEVHAERGGMACIRVRDDGSGLHRDDLALALERHATSKVASLEELESVVTLGFRGEALPSIASVSRLVIVSRTREAGDAWRVSVNGDPSSLEPRPAAHSPGTTVEVRDLFFSTPARRRFLRTERTELRHLEQVFRRVALSRMDVAMSFTHGEREVLRVARADSARGRLERARRILRAGFMDNVHDVSLNRDELSVEGWIQGPDSASARPDQQYLFVNGRAVVDATVRHAVRLAYGERLQHGLHPGWILFLSLPASDVDVNVHPTKQEVRFHETRRLHDFVRSAAVHSFSDEPLDMSLSSSTGAPRATAVVERAAAVAEPGAAACSLDVLALLDGGILVAREGTDLVLASIPALVAANARARLSGAASGEALPARPLLIPERFSWPHDERGFEAMAKALAPLGVTVRLVAPGVGVLQGLPACLEPVPAQALCAELQAPPHQLAITVTWVEHLLAAAPSARVRRASEALSLLDAVSASLDEDQPRPWRRFTTEALARLIDEH